MAAYGKIFLLHVRGVGMQAEIRRAVVDVIDQIQSSSGREIPAITGTMCPLTDIAGFDSLNAVEVSCLLSARLGWEVPPDLMFPEGNDRPPTVDDIVDRLVTMIAEEEGNE